METITTPQGRRLAVRREAGQGPHVVFLGGFRSDMTGTKAAWLSDWAREKGRAFLRFDYSGHGDSEGQFEEGAITHWREDAEAALDLAPGPVVLVGSSMGGWISLLIARANPERVAGLVTIAAAPDFTETMWADAPGFVQTRILEDGPLRGPLGLRRALPDHPEPHRGRAREPGPAARPCTCRCRCGCSRAPPTARCRPRPRSASSTMSPGRTSG